MFVMLSEYMCTPVQSTAIEITLMHNDWFASLILCQLSYKIKSIRISRVSCVSRNNAPQ